MRSAHFAFLLLCLSIAALFMVPPLTMKGLFMDGQIYAAISHNMANGSGSFWSPALTGDIYNPFYEHPPLMFGLESLFFRVFGDSILIERFFSLLMCAFVMILFAVILKKTNGNHSNYGWPAILFWITTPIIFWSFSNNMIENVMSVVYLLATVFALNHKRSGSWIWLLLIAASVVAGILLKGPTGLFPLVLPFVLGFNKSRPLVRNFIPALFTTILAVFLFSLILIDPNARESLQFYFDHQVTESISGDRVVVQRTLVLERVVLELIPAMLVAIAYFFIRIKKLSNVPVADRQNSLRFLVLGLCATLPIMISPKQLIFYIVPAIPFYILAIVYILNKRLHTDISSLTKNRLTQPVVVILAGIVFLLSVFLAFDNRGKFRRDKDLLSDTEKIGEALTYGDEVFIHGSIHDQWQLFAELSRSYGIECYRGTEKGYMIANSGAEIEGNWEEIDIETNTLKLYVRR